MAFINSHAFGALDVPSLKLGRGMKMVWFKSCKRCSGDLYLGKDSYGSFVSCMQCGAVAADFEQRFPTSVIADEMASLVTQRRSA